MKLRTYLTDFAALLFPQLCQACGDNLISGEDLICTDCIYNLPYTNFHQLPDNVVARQFWGRLNLEAAYAMLYFIKGGKVQQLMHAFKYDNVPQIGNKLGAIAGEQLKQHKVFKNADAIIPVPLHKTRQRKRGYNQSAFFAEGIAAALNRPVLCDNLVRTKATVTQTHKSRFERAVNMQGVFTLAHPEQLISKHILLVDDIITTGATLEACAAALLTVPGLQLSIATIAYAE